MRRLFKILVYLLILVVVLIGGAALAFLYAPSDTIERMAEDSVEQATGRKLTISGDIERSLFPVLGFKATEIAFANADWASGDPLIEAQSAEIGLRLLPLLGGGIEVEKLAIVEPKIHVEIAEDGRRSWELEGADVVTGARADLEERAGAEVGGSAQIDILVEALTIENGRMTIIDRSAGGDPIVVEDIQLAGAFPSLEEALTVEGSAVAQGRPATLELTLDTPAKLGRGEAALLKAALTSEGVEARIDGEFQTPSGAAAPGGKGVMALKLDGDKERTAWVRALLPAELAPLGAVAVDGVFDVAEDKLDVALDGTFGFRGRDTRLDAKAAAGAGWTGGAEPVDLNVALANGLLEARFEGTVAQPPNADPTIAGTYAAKIADIAALNEWAGRPAPAPGDPIALLESVDLGGRVSAGADAMSADLKGSVVYNRATVAVDGAVSGPAGWDEGAPMQTRLDASAPALFDLGWEGTVATPAEGPSVQGAARFGSTALRAFFEWLGLGPIDAPGGTFESVAFKSGIEVTPERGAFDDIDLLLDKSAVTGRIAYDLGGDRPAVEATLTSGPLDIRPFTKAAASGGGGSGGGGGGAPAGGGWSKEPFDLGALRLVDAKIDVTTEGLATNVIRLGRTQVTADLTAGKLVAQVKEMALYGGSATGQATLDGSGETPSMAIKADVAGVALRPLLNDASQIDWLEGTGAVKLDISGRGASEDALMRSLGGSASIDFRNGAIIGYNLAAIVRNVTNLGQSGEQQKTDFAEMTASFQIANGVARNDDFFMAGPLVRLTGKGVIDIGNQSLNYRAVPKAVATLEGQGGGRSLSGIAFPILISGPWANPSITPDLAGGALESVEGLLADPEGAGAFLNELGGSEDLGKALEGVLGGGGAGDGGGSGGGGLGDALQGLTGGGDGGGKNPLGGLFGN